MNITASLFGQVVAFILLIWFVNRVLWGPLTRAMAERQKKISDGLAAAEQGNESLEQAKEDTAALFAEAKTKSAALVAQAEKRAAEIVAEAKGDAEQEAGRVMDQAQTEILQQVAQAREKLRSQVAELAAEGASRILQRSINAKGHEKLLKDLVEQI